MPHPSEYQAKPVSFTRGQLDRDAISIEKQRILAEQLRQENTASLLAETPRGAPVTIPAGLAKLLRADTARRKSEEAEAKEEELIASQEAYDVNEAEEIRHYIESLSPTGQQRQAGQQVEIARQQAVGVPDAMQTPDYQRQYTSKAVQEAQLAQALAQAGKRGTTPSSVNEFEYRQGLEGGLRGDLDEEFIRGKRALPRLYNAGDEFVDPRDPNRNIPISLRPGEVPSVRGEQQAAQEAAITEAIPKRVSTETTAQLEAIPQLSEAEAAAAAEKQEAIDAAKATGETKITLAEMQARLPRLEDVVKELSNLGETATYTYRGRAWNAAKREFGMDVGKGAVARAEYISKVANEILPLLKSTFGAAFTVAEGESLKATLGDPNVSPPEKDAVLRSFIDNKTEQIKTEERKLQNIQGTSEERKLQNIQGTSVDEEIKKLEQELGINVP